MSASTRPAAALDRYTTMGELSLNVRGALQKMLFPIGIALALAALSIAVTRSPGLIAFTLMGSGAMLALWVWAGAGKGVPILPMIVVQQLVISGMPIVTHHEIVSSYPESFVTEAGVEVFIFCCSLVAAWKVGLNAFSAAPPIAYALVGVDREGIAGLSRLGFGLAVAATGVLFLQSLNLFDVLFSLLPAGMYPIVAAVVAAASACGFFLLAMILGSGELKPTGRIMFWTLMSANCLISASSLLLSSAFGVISAVVIGLMWSTGRPPWRFIILTMTLISLMNIGKYGMRDRYWRNLDADRPEVTMSLTRLPSFYAEWAQCTAESLAASHNPPPTIGYGRAVSRGGEQSLFERLNNLQNLLYVIDAMERGKVTPLNGETYALIPPLLIPRIFWPEKPRTHEGQVRLNVHFGRQLLESTLTTYIAWGLLAEAYGNFGAVKGSIIIGAALGLFFAWAEMYTSRKPLLSTEGFIAFAIFLGLANSYEMVASVAVTSIFQSLVPIIAACAPFVRRKTVVRPATG